MGGRMASLVADDSSVDGLICLGFPFHAPGKDVGKRIEHLEKLKTKTIIVQGTRDSMGTREDVAEYALSQKIKFCWLDDGDHSFKPRVKSGNTLEQHLESASQAILEFVSI